MRKIAVLGAGITGVTTAYTLREQGFDVTLFDRQRYAGTPETKLLEPFKKLSRARKRLITSI